ncbi:MAG: hypothetical protein J2P54_14165, partial [Bradyrhizobiaceae bacterium]|nr:hypothetical protein [Bradyrhizobiaceae bacterium]
MLVLLTIAWMDGGGMRAHRKVTKALSCSNRVKNIGNAYANLRLAFDAVPEGVALFDSEDCYLLWNRRYEELATFGS